MIVNDAMSLGGTNDWNLAKARIKNAINGKGGTDIKAVARAVSQGLSAIGPPALL